MPLGATAVRDLQKLLAANSTDNSFPSRVPTATTPSGAGVLDLSVGGSKNVPNNLMLLPYAVASDNDTFNVRILGWSLVVDLYVPIILAEVACTACARVGVAAKTVINTERFCDTLTLTYGNSGISTEVVSPANDTIGHVLIDLKGHSMVEVIFDINSGTTSMNALYRTL